MFYANENKKKAGVAILLAEKRDSFKKKTNNRQRKVLTNDKEVC